MSYEAPSPAASAPPAGWYPDPSDRNSLRWWDGSQWTGHRSTAAPQPRDGAKGTAAHYVLPTGRSGWAIAAGYFGLFSGTILLAPLALACGALALGHLRRRPELGGRGRAWFGLITGALGTIALVLMALAW